MSTRAHGGAGHATGDAADAEPMADADATPAELVAESELERSRAQLRRMLHEDRELRPGSGTFPRSRLMRAAMDSRYRPLLLAGGAAAMLLIGRRLPIARVAALVNGYRMVRRFWPKSTL